MNEISHACEHCRTCGETVKNENSGEPPPPRSALQQAPEPNTLHIEKVNCGLGLGIRKCAPPSVTPERDQKPLSEDRM